MSKICSVTDISDLLELQQETVDTVDKYTQPILSNIKSKQTYHADYVMHHIFTNIRNTYQDSIFLSQGLIKSKPYYISTSLYYAQRESNDFLTDLAYIMRDRKNRIGDEHIRYLLFILQQQKKQYENVGLKTQANKIKNSYDHLLSENTHLEPKGSFWSTIKPEDKKKQGLAFYKIETPDFTDHLHSIRHDLSSAAHGNRLTIYTFTRTPEENTLQLEAELTYSVALFDAVMRSAIKCYFRLYLNKPNDCKTMISPISHRIDCILDDKSTP